MGSCLADVWNNRTDPNLGDSAEVEELRSLIKKELSRESTVAEIENHILRHYRNPNFTTTGIPVARWVQDSHGYYSFDGIYGKKMIQVAYYRREGKFLFAELLIHPRPTRSPSPFNSRIYLTEPVDEWDYSYLEDDQSN